MRSQRSEERGGAPFFIGKEKFMGVEAILPEQASIFWIEKGRDVGMLRLQGGQSFLIIDRVKFEKGL